jgi:hypothetical protein
MPSLIASSLAVGSAIGAKGERHARKIPLVMRLRRKNDNTNIRWKHTNARNGAK